MRLWEVKSGQELREYRGATGQLRAVAFSPDGLQALSGSEDGSVRLWDLGKGQKQNPRAFVGLSDKVEVAYAPDGTKVAASSVDGKVIVWDVQTQRKVQRWEMPGAVYGIAFAADSRHLLTANGDGTAYILRFDEPPADKGVHDAK
jgi:WD40 repeat protein